MELTAGVRAGRAARIQFFASAWALMARSHPRIALGRGARNAHAPGGILDADDVVYEDSLLRIARIPGRGHGVTAVRGFEAGDLVLEEAPFVRVPNWLPPAEGHESHPYNIHELVFFSCSRVCALTARRLCGRRLLCATRIRYLTRLWSRPSLSSISSPLRYRISGWRCARCGR